MPLQKITLEVETKNVPEEKRADLGQELLRAANGILGPWLASRDALQGEIVKWEQK